ncbi:MAG: hypothetical protein WB290_17340 [Smithella sp.]
MIGKVGGFTKVTRASLQIKDRSIYPPDRNLFSYFQLQPDGVTVLKVDGSWGDYLRDLDMGIVVKQQAPINDSEKTDGEMIITDIFPEGIPDPVYLPDPMLPY